MATAAETFVAHSMATLMALDPESPEFYLHILGVHDTTIDALDKKYDELENKYNKLEKVCADQNKTIIELIAKLVKYKAKHGDI